MDIHPLPSILQKQKKPFCQTFFRTASAPPEELLLERSQSHFQRSQSPAKQALNRVEGVLVLPPKAQTRLHAGETGIE